MMSATLRNYIILSYFGGLTSSRNGKERPQRSIEWLQENGVCVDQLIVMESEIDDTGQGAFARQGFAKGQVVSHAPLLHLKRDDMNIYKPITEMKGGSQQNDWTLIISWRKS
jgi:hypothetical protein